MSEQTETGVRITVPKKQGDTPFFVESLTNRFNGERQIQLNEAYVPKGAAEDEFAHGRKTVNINVIDIPEIVKAMVVLYEEETGKEVTL